VLIAPLSIQIRRAGVQKKFVGPHLGMLVSMRLGRFSAARPRHMCSWCATELVNRPENIAMTEACADLQAAERQIMAARSWVLATEAQMAFSSAVV
jgi:hypothetical protein